MGKFEQFIQLIRDNSDGALQNASTLTIVAMLVVAILLAIATVFAISVSVYLGVCYVKFNKAKNSLGKTGKDIAREVLDSNDLKHIKVIKNGSILFGNSYSHYFKRVRLRRRTWKKDSISSMAMAYQKSCLAILDKEGDRDMQRRVKMTPFIYFGPIAFIPMIIVGVVLDALLFGFAGVLMSILIVLSDVAYLLAFVMSIAVLKTEKKAQALALQKMQGVVTDEELQACKKLFKLYNIEYVNDMIIALLEFVYRILEIVALKENSSSFSND